MILTCPSCSTQYAVKEGAIPPQGRQVRCASCKHAWHQNPEDSAAVAGGAPVEAVGSPNEGSLAGNAPSEDASGETMANEDAPGGAFDEPGEQFADAQATDPVGFAAVDPIAPPGDALGNDTMPAQTAGGTGAWTQPAERIDEGRANEAELAGSPADIVAPAAAETPYDDRQTADDEDFSPFTMEERNGRPARSPLVRLLMVAALIAALAAAFWFLAPDEWKQRVGIATNGETPLQLMMTHSDRQKLASGNELLAVSGRVINPTDEQQDVPPIRAQLRSNSGRLVYSWTIAPPARTLPPGASATFNSAEVNVPAGGDELTITLGANKT